VDVWLGSACLIFPDSNVAVMIDVAVAQRLKSGIDQTLLGFLIHSKVKAQWFLSCYFVTAPWQRRIR
jgi:hypothetical protein